MELLVLKQAERELEKAPQDLRQDIFSLFDDLMRGKSLSFPLSRPLPLIAKGLHELRLSGRAGEYRIFYLIRTKQGAIFVIHAMIKKSQKIDRQTINLIRYRIRGLE